MAGIHLLDPVDRDQLVIKPLGAGQEVGRSCVLVEFKGKTIMLDCGIHPGLTGFDQLPYFDHIEDQSKVDLVLITHFHLDHCGALPYYLLKTNFKGKCFMTNPTKPIYRLLLSDYCKVSNITTEERLFDERHVEQSCQYITTIGFHQDVDEKGIKFTALHAGHVLGGCMYQIEIAGVRLLYTGDFSCVEDRHLMAAEVPKLRPDVLICESTYGTHMHEKREDREARFTGLVHEIVARGGRCLIPVFALGRAQELLLIIEEYWEAHKDELQDIPVYYASSLGKRCLQVYRTFIKSMNQHIQKQGVGAFELKHIQDARSLSQHEDIGPCVVLASPGMLQNGLSRELFESWCTDRRNGVIIAGYSVEGTLARQILSEPDDITAMNGQRLPLKCSVDYISFSAHTDYKQTSEFIRRLRPPHIILVHGEQNEMHRLETALTREYEYEQSQAIGQGRPYTMAKIYSPRNTQAVQLQFRGEKIGKVIGTLAKEHLEHGHPAGQKLPDLLEGIVVEKSFNYKVVAPNDLHNYTELRTSRFMQRQSVSYQSTWEELVAQLSLLNGSPLQPIEDKEMEKKVRVFDSITVTWKNKTMCLIEWEASPVADMFADSVMAVVLACDIDREPLQSAPESHGAQDFGKAVLRTLEDMFGSSCVQKLSSYVIHVKINEVEALIDLMVDPPSVECKTDELFEQNLTTIVGNLKAAMEPISRPIMAGKTR